MAFGFQPSARANPVEIAVDVELQQITGRVAGPARLLRRDTRKPGGREIEPVHEGVDEADGIVGIDVIVDRLGEQEGLRTVDAGYVRHDAMLVQLMHRWKPVNESFHTVCVSFERQPRHGA